MVARAAYGTAEFSFVAIVNIYSHGSFAQKLPDGRFIYIHRWRNGKAIDYCRMLCSVLPLERSQTSRSVRRGYKLLPRLTETPGFHFSTTLAMGECLLTKLDATCMHSTTRCTSLSVTTPDCSAIGRDENNPSRPRPPVRLVRLISASANAAVEKLETLHV